MIRFDIHSIEQLQCAGRLRTVFGDDKHVSITLSEQIRDLPDAEVLAERMLLLLPDGRGTYKRTYAHRFDAFDDAVVHRLRELGIEGSEAVPIMVHDVAVSDARTSCDFFARLTNLTPHVRYIASDYDPYLTVLVSGRAKLVLDSAGTLLEVVWPPFVFNLLNTGRLLHHPRYYLYPINILVKRLVLRFVVRPILARHRAGEQEGIPLTLFAPRAQSLAASDERFRLVQFDILNPEPLGRGVDVLRAMNVLNHSYFTRDEFRRILHGFHKTLAPGGLLVTGSNQDPGSTVNGGLYARTNEGFERIWRSGSGSPIEDLIVSFHR